MIAQPVIDLFEDTDLDRERMEKLSPKQLYDAYKIECEKVGVDAKKTLIDLILKIAATHELIEP